MIEVVAKGPEEAIAQSEVHINDFLFRGGADTEAEDAQVGEKFGVGELIKAAWANAKEIEGAWLEQAAQSRRDAEEQKPSSFLPKLQPSRAAAIEKPAEVVECKPPPQRNLEQTPAPKPGGGAIRLIRRPDGEWVAVREGEEPKAAAPKPKLRGPEAKELQPQTAGDVIGGMALAKAAPVVAKPASPLTFQHSKNPAGIPASLENAIIAVDALGAECRYDVFHDRIIVKGHECGVRGDAHENLENVTLKVRQAVLERFGFDPSANFTLDALKLRCLDHIFDPVRDYLDGLRWDEVKRLDEWLVRYCGAENTPLNRAIGRKMLVAAVRRVREPGCKFDYIVALEGRQGVGKSTLLKILAGEDNFSDNEILGLHKREQQEAIQGVWIYEVAELEGLSKSEVTKVKLFASKTFDGARPAYGRSWVDRPRRCIFVATTNEDTYLRDTTGNRRFWPVCVGVIDLAGVRKDRDQLWAEAAAVEAGGEPLVIPQQLWPDVAAQQEARMELDPWEDTIARELARLIRLESRRVEGSFVIEGSFVKAADANGDPEWRVSTDHLLTNVLSLPKERQNNNHTKRLAGIMRGLGWLRSETPMRFGKAVARGFRKSCVESDVTGATRSLHVPSTPLPRSTLRRI